MTIRAQYKNVHKYLILKLRPMFRMDNNIHYMYVYIYGYIPVCATDC